VSGYNRKSRLLGRLFQLGWFVGYLITMAAILCGMIALRNKQLDGNHSASTQADWQQWRHEVERQSTGKGPVQRSIPKSLDPPIMILFSENFAVILIFSLLFGSAFYFIFYFFVRATLSRQAEIDRDGEA
jgi:Na+/H+-dicarboxylate symporter